MYIRPVAGLLFCVLALGFVSGCKESGSSASVPAVEPETNAVGDSEPQRPEVALRLHWLGKKKLSTMQNATNFMSIWAWPESIRLENQTLDKLSVAPWRLLNGEAAVSNAPIALLRPLLTDVIQSESFLEINNVTNGVGEFAFAIRLDETRSARWSTNLAQVAESLTGTRVSESSDWNGWILRKRGQSSLVDFAHVGEWVVAGYAQERNETLETIVKNIRTDGTPYLGFNDENWLKAEFNVNLLAQLVTLDWKPLTNPPQVRMMITGTGENVSARADLKFSHPLNLKLEPWNIPTNLAGGPLNGFTAIRGTAPWLEGRKLWNDLRFGPPPNQFYTWTSPGIPAQLFFAAPNSIDGKQFDAFTARLMETINPLLKPGNWGTIEHMPDASGIHWVSLPFAAPFIESVQTNSPTWIYGGSFIPPKVVVPIPPALVSAINGQSNLVYYDWEITGPRIQTESYWFQMLRLISEKSQIPDDSAAGAWLLAAMGKLGNAGTQVFQTDTKTFSISRASPVGFTAIELELLADWLESPLFPRGLHTFVAPPPPKPAPPPGLGLVPTNSPRGE